MAKVPTNISIDADIKAQAQTLLADMGMDLSTAVNIFLRQMVRDHAIPFAIRTDPIHPMEKAGGRTGSEEVRNL
jgi:DNA-damage-inducible protein J